MIKKIAILVFALIVAVGVGAYFYFDAIVKSGIEVVGSRVLGTAVTVDNVAISPLNGSGSIEGLTIANVEGYNSEYAFQLGSLSVNINASTIFSDVLEIQSLHIIQPRINYETRIVQDNIRALINNLPRGGAEAEPGSEQASSRVIIRELVLESPQLNLVAANLSAPVPLPDIRMRNIGQESSAATVADALRIVLIEISGAILRSDALEELGQGVGERLRDAVEDAAEDIGSRLRDILN